MIAHYVNKTSESIKNIKSMKITSPQLNKMEKMWSQVKSSTLMTTTTIMKTIWATWMRAPSIHSKIGTICNMTSIDLWVL